MDVDILPIAGTDAIHLNAQILLLQSDNSVLTSSELLFWLLNEVK